MFTFTQVKVCTMSTNDASSAVDRGASTVMVPHGSPRRTDVPPFWSSSVSVSISTSPRRRRRLPIPLYRDAQPAWLRKSRCLQRRRRALELHAESCRSAVAVATELQDDLRNRGIAYGDPVLAQEILERRLGHAERGLRELNDRREAFLATQAAAEVMPCTLRKDSLRGGGPDSTVVNASRFPILPRYICSNSTNCYNV